jgi:hypothetical protein
MALVKLYLFRVLLRSIRYRSPRWGCIAAAVIVLTLFTHANTWGVMGVLAVFIFVLSSIVVVAFSDHSDFDGLILFHG